MSLLANLPALWAYGLAQPADLVAVAAVVAGLVLALAVAARRLAGAALAPRQPALPPATLRQTRFASRPEPRQSDPDARGHRRPRAPAPYPCAA